MSEKKTIKGSKALKDINSQKIDHNSNQELKKFIETRDNKNKITTFAETLEAEMDVKKVLYEDSLKEVELPEGFSPMFNGVFTTAKRNNIVDENGLFLPTAALGDDLDIDYQLEQKVMAVGPQCQQVKKGDTIVINIEHFKARSENMAGKVNNEFKYKLPIVTVKDKDYLMISERDILYINN